MNVENIVNNNTKKYSNLSNIIIYCVKMSNRYGKTFKIYVINTYRKLIYKNNNIDNKSITTTANNIGLKPIVIMGDEKEIKRRTIKKAIPEAFGKLEAGRIGGHGLCPIRINPLERRVCNTKLNSFGVFV